MTEEEFVRALRRAIASANPAWRAQPSHLRRRLEEELGTAAIGERALIHQTVVAVAEQVPLRLERSGWSPALHAELVETLVRVRGWTHQASDRAVATWAQALDLDVGLRPESAGTSDAGSDELTIQPSAVDQAPTVLPSEPEGPPVEGSSRVDSGRPDSGNDQHAQSSPESADDLLSLRGTLDDGSLSTASSAAVPVDPRPPREADQTTRRSRVRIAIIVVGLIVGGYFYVTQSTPVDDLSRGDCITGGEDWKEVSCDSAAAVWRIGAPCEFILTLSAGGDSGEFCAHTLADLADEGFDDEP